MTVPILEMKGITKTFPGVIANSDVNLQIFQGEIHALLGENGAGKSTLMNVLTGIYKPDDGEILYHGDPYNIKKPKDAVNIGIGMVHQHFKLVEPLTVTENVFLGSKECRQVLDMAEMSKKVTVCSEEFGLQLENSAKIWQLSIGEQQRVEIVKLLFRGTEILILDEPTAVLTPGESISLFRVLRKMADKGKAIIFITHKMYEVMAHSDRITVLRGGKSVASMLNKDTNREELTRLMVGKELKNEKCEENLTQGPVVLELNNVEALNDRGLPALCKAILSVHSGEILGIAGVAGNGQKELAEVITGLRKCTGGHVLLSEKDITNHNPKELLKNGVAFIPEDRLGMGLVPNLSMEQNAVLRDYDNEGFSKGGFLRFAAMKKKANLLVEEYEIRSAGTKRPVKLMSGGNQQKLLIAREIWGKPKLVVAAYPVRGLDIGATDAVHSILLEQKKAGAAILLISEDLDELFAISDRIAVLYEGRITGIVNTQCTSYEEVGCLMVGIEEGNRA